MEADLVTYLNGLNPLDRRTHCRLASFNVLLPVPAELAEPALTADIREEDLTEEQWALTNANDPDWEALGLTLEAFALASADEVTLLSLPGFWGYLNRRPRQFHASGGPRLLARLTGRFTGLKVSPRDGAFVSRIRAETVAKQLRDRLTAARASASEAAAR
jgi:hypothetical protein